MVERRNFGAFSDEECANFGISQHTGGSLRKVREKNKREEVRAKRYGGKLPLCHCRDRRPRRSVCEAKHPIFVSSLNEAQRGNPVFVKNLRAEVKDLIGAKRRAPTCNRPPRSFAAARACLFRDLVCMACLARG